MMRAAALVVMLAVAGCATNAVLDHAPVMTLTSDQSPDRLEECIGLGLSGIGNVSTIRGEGRRTMTFGAAGATAASVTITGDHPAQLEVRQAIALNQKWRDRVRRCAETGEWRAAR